MKYLFPIDAEDNTWTRNVRLIHTTNPPSRTCNLCGARFIEHSRFDRFCESCRNTDELYHYAEWATYS